MAWRRGPGGMPGPGGGGGGGPRGGLAVCGMATKGGGGSGGAGGCGGRGGRGGGNAQLSIAILALHAKVTVRDSFITSDDGGYGGDGGEPEEGGKAGRAAPRRPSSLGTSSFCRASVISTDLTDSAALPRYASKHITRISSLACLSSARIAKSREASGHGVRPCPDSSALTFGKARF